MDVRKASELADDYEREGKEYLRLATELRAAIKRAQNGHALASVAEKPRRGMPKLKSKRNPGSLLAISMKIMRDRAAPLHMNDLLPLVNDVRGKEHTRASLEAAVSRGVKAGKVKRTAPSTFEVQ